MDNTTVSKEMLPTHVDIFQSKNTAPCQHEEVTEDGRSPMIPQKWNDLLTSGDL